MNAPCNKYMNFITCLLTLFCSYGMNIELESKKVQQLSTDSDLQACERSVTDLRAENQLFFF